MDNSPAMGFGSPHLHQGADYSNGSSSSPHLLQGADYSNGSSSSQSSDVRVRQPVSSANAYIDASVHPEISAVTAARMGSIHRSVSTAHNRSASGTSDAILSASAPPGAVSTRSAGEASAALLDTYKHIIAEVESYLTVFDARARLEEDYVRGLKTISDKARDGVLRQDVRLAPTELPGLRVAWRDMLQDQMREMDARARYIETLRQGVIAPLLSYRDAQERIRKRVKEDVKTSIAAHEEMRNHTLPRAKKTYEKRSEEAESVRLQQQAIEDQRTLLSHPSSQRHASPSRLPASLSPTLSATEFEDEHLSESGTAGTSPGRGPSFKVNRVTRRGESDGSDRSSANQYSGSDGVARGYGEDNGAAHSPPLAPGSFGPATQDGKKGNFFDALRSRENWDTARKEAPKKLNALISRMREGNNTSSERSGEGTRPSSSGGVLSMSPESGAIGVGLGNGPGSMRSTQNVALRHSKAKREAEEADAVYRKAVFDLETLRLRREKTLQAARGSILEARRELHTTCRAIWTQEKRSAQSLANANLNLSLHGEEILRHSLENLDNELEALNARLPIIDDDKVRYINYHVGECKDLVFGVSLVDYAFSRAQQGAPQLGPGKAEAPLIVRKCIAFIEEHALDQPGIYRTSAKHTALQALAHAIECDEERFDFEATDEDPAAVAGVLKLFLRKLPDPILPMRFEERLRYTQEREEHIQTGFASLKGRIRRLPAVNQATLRTIIEHLAKVAAHSEHNRMTASNLSIIFGPLLLSQADHETTSLAAAMVEDRVTEDLITYADTIFDLARAGAPILPPVPLAKDSAEWENVEATVSGPTLPSRPVAAPPAASLRTLASGTDLQSTLDAFPAPQNPQYAESVHGSHIAATQTASRRFSLDEGGSTQAEVSLPETAVTIDTPASMLLSAQQPHISTLSAREADDNSSIWTENDAADDDTLTTPTSASTMTGSTTPTNGGTISASTPHP